MNIKRIPITTVAVDAVINEFKEKFRDAIQKHGNGACFSLHEIRGMIDEEMDEIKKAAHQNDIAGIRSECLDLMVACLWGIASIDVGAATEKWE